MDVDQNIDVCSKSKISTLLEAESNISSKANMYIKSAVRVDIAKG